MEALTLKTIGLICLGPCRRGMQNEILASHFEVHLNLMCTHTLQFQLWLSPVVYTTGQPRSGTCTSECPGNRFRAPLSLPGAISHRAAVISTAIGGTPKLFFLLVFFFLPFFLACFFFSNQLAYYCFKCPELNIET